MNSVASLGRALARHAGLSHRECAALFGALGEALAAREDAHRLTQIESDLPIEVRRVFQECWQAYCRPPEAARGMQSLGDQLARLSALSDDDCGCLFGALSLAAAQIHVGHWDRVELQRSVQRLPLRLREPFAALVRAYEGGGT